MVRERECIIYVQYFFLNVNDRNYYENRGSLFIDHPMTGISWNDAVAYAEWLSQRTNQSFSLPTEAEWEYAARGGQEGIPNNFTYAGSNNADEVAWNNENANGQTHAVGTKRPNGLGTYDMSGNVWEWCTDRYDSYSDIYADGDSIYIDPKGPAEGDGRVLRGGSWTAIRSSVV